MIDLWYLLLIAAGISSGGYLLLFSRKDIIGQTTRSAGMMSYIKGMQKTLIHGTKQEELLFREAALPCSVAQYNVARWVLFSGGLVWGTLRYLQTQQLSYLMFTVVTILVLSAISTPKWAAEGRYSPLRIVRRALQERRKQQYDQELYKTIGQLKNICITQKNNPQGGDAILENLLHYAELTRPILAQTISIIRLQQYEEARLYFTRSIGTKLSRDFVHILLELHRVEPQEFIQQLTLFQEAEREKRLTERLNEQESLSLLLYVPAMTTCVVILLDFIMVTLWISARTTFL